MMNYQLKLELFKISSLRVSMMHYLGLFSLFILQLRCGQRRLSTLWVVFCVNNRLDGGVWI